MPQPDNLPMIGINPPSGFASTLKPILRIFLAFAYSMLGPCALLSADVLEGQANQRQIIPGGRAAMMGGAYTALSDDASGAYYNPAGLTFSQEDGINLSTTLYRESNLIFKETINEEPFDQQSHTIIPGFIGGTKKAGDFAFGYSFITLDASNVYQQNTFENISTQDNVAKTFSRTHQESSNYVLAGGSWSYKINSNYSIGHSIYNYQRQTKSSTYQIATFNGGGTSSIFDTFETLNTGITHISGIMARSGIFSIGASAKKSYILDNNSSRIVETVLDDPIDDDESTIVQRYDVEHKVMNEMNPTTYRVGLAILIPGAFSLSADYLVHEGVHSLYRELGGADLIQTENYSVGIEMIYGNLTLRGGAFSNNSMHAEPIEGETNQPLYLNYKGTSGGLGWNIANIQGHIGFIQQRGAGKAQVVTNSSDIQDVEAVSTLYLISGKIPLQ
jgi:hypothetical protein